VGFSKQLPPATGIGFFETHLSMAFEEMYLSYVRHKRDKSSEAQRSPPPIPLREGCAFATPRHGNPDAKRQESRMGKNNWAESESFANVSTSYSDSCGSLN